MAYLSEPDWVTFLGSVGSTILLVIIPLKVPIESWLPRPISVMPVQMRERVYLRIWRPFKEQYQYFKWLILMPIGWGILLFGPYFVVQHREKLVPWQLMLGILGTVFLGFLLVRYVFSFDTYLDRYLFRRYDRRHPRFSAGRECWNCGGTGKWPEVSPDGESFDSHCNICNGSGSLRRRYSVYEIETWR